jgi:hypothetical protein
MSHSALNRLSLRLVLLLGLHSALQADGRAQEAVVSAAGEEALQPHAGLLGKRFVAGRYAYLAHGDEVLNRIDRGFDGFSAGLNVPILLPDAETWLGIDAFTSWGTIGLGGATHFASTGIQLDTQDSQTAVGGTFYVDPLEPIRPLLQAGAVFSRSRSLLLINGFGGTSVDRETDLLLRAGLEADVNDWLAIRTVLDIDTAGHWDDSTFLGDVIAWPTERIFLRGGVISPLSGHEIGGHVGVGLTF